MPKSQSTRPWGRWLALAVLVVGCMLALTVALGRSADAQSTASPAAGPITQRELALRNGMRKLWEEHVTWTRLSIVSFAGGLPDLVPTEQRLLQNQVDIGNAVKPFYGQQARRRLTQLLRRHILLAVAILGDLKSGNSTALHRDLRLWYANADRIAVFLHTLNPKHWPLATLRQMMHRPLALTTREAVAEISGHYQASINAYDRVEDEILQMADTLSKGIIAQFPHRFR